MPSFLTAALNSRRNAVNWSDVGFDRVVVSISNVIGNKRLSVYEKSQSGSALLQSETEDRKDDAAISG
jgi:hypothetical protein